MLTSFIHIGDGHLQPGPRQEDRLRALDQIITEGLALPNLGAWLWPGDLFHAGAAARDCNGIDERLQRMAKKAPVVICYGNHDAPGDLDGFARLYAPYPVYVIDRPRVVSVPLAGGHSMASIFVLPYPHKGGLVAAGVAKNDVVPAAADLLEPIFIEAAAQLEKDRAAGNLPLMIGHVNVAGSIASTGQPNIGREIELSPRHLDRLGPIYKGLNHIHKAQDLHGAYYAGSICRLNWGEVEPKSYVVITYDTESRAQYRDGIPSMIERRPLDVAPMFHVEGTLSLEDGFVLGNGYDVVTDSHEIGNRYMTRDWKGCEVRVRYRCKSSEKAVLDEARVRAPFTDAARLKVECLVDLDRDVRAPEVAAATTLEGKLVAYLHAPLADGLRFKLAALEAGDDEQILRDVTARLSELETASVAVQEVA